MIIDSSSREAITPWLRLTLVPGVSASVQRALLRRFGGVRSALEAAPADVAACAGDIAVAHRLAAGPDPRLLERTLEWLAGDDRHLVTLEDPGYPGALREIADPPIALYVQGKIDALNRPSFAVVGSRNATAQGVRDAEELAQALSDAGLCIVSGLALGIDAAAHRGGVAGAAGSIAVMGTGPDVIYPRANGDLARSIAERGCLVTEFALGIPSAAGNFPRRNRLISGLSKGVLVVEAALPSGSLLTAAAAIDQNREVFAMPGSVHSPLSKGCHKLIKQGAKLVETVEDILEEFGWEARGSRDRPSPPDSAAENDELLTAMGRGPVTFDDVAERTGMTTGALCARLSRLQIEGRVAALPGGRFQRVSGQVIK